MKAPEFPEADYYECSRGLEIFEHEDPVSAVVDFCDSGWEQDARDEGLVVYCYRRAPVPGTIGKRLAPSVIELIVDELQELLDPFGDSFETPLLPVLETTIQAIADGAHVWHCEEFAKVELTGAQVAAILEGARDNG